MNNLITAAQKDAVLHTLFELSNGGREATSDYVPFQSIVTFDQLEQILKLFSRLGLIDLYHLYEIDIHLELRAEADQFIQRGGFMDRNSSFKNQSKTYFRSLRM